MNSTKPRYELSRPPNSESNAAHKQSTTIRLKPAHLFRMQLFPVILVTLLLFGLSFGPSTEATPGKKTLPPNLESCQYLQPPIGSTMACHAYASGVHIYRWNGTGWGFLFPDATLFSDAEKRNAIGYYYAGPTWETNNDNKIVGKVLEGCTSSQDAIPWQLVKVVSTEGTGIFQHTTHVQRVNTSGGEVPKEPGKSVGEVAKVPYTAEYFFYRNQNN